MLSYLQITQERLFFLRKNVRRQCLQKVCPQSKVMGLTNKCKQIEHFNSFFNNFFYISLTNVGSLQKQSPGPISL